jgi:hypothetical protein
MGEQGRHLGGWPDQPVIVEINTWVWLAELTEQQRRPIDLASVPPEAWEAACPPGVDAVWLMGVWERSAAGVDIARDDPGVRADMEAALPDLTDTDVVGSPYCVRSYTVDRRLGGGQGLAAARAALAAMEVRLVVDYVPNHVARDHRWVQEHPEFLVLGDRDDLRSDPRSFALLDERVVALGRDPHYPAWTDVVQLNAFSRRLRDATAGELATIAQQADGVRCDMAMLMLNDVFAGTWGDRVGPPPTDEFWPGVIADVRNFAPDVIFIAEVYWGLEPPLLEQGFDYCYDKTLHDLLTRLDVPGLRAHLGAAVSAQRRLLRFVENHDEPRVAAAVPVEAQRAVAVAVATLPGGLLLHEGQFEGRRVRPPVQLGRRPPEPADQDLRAFWEGLLDAAAPARGGTWHQLTVHGWTENDTSGTLLAWCWDYPRSHALTVVVNLGPDAAKGQIQIDPPADTGDVVYTDLLSGQEFVHDAQTVTTYGLHVELGPWGFHLLRT